MASIIELSDISKIYANAVVGVDHVSLSIEDGEFVTLLGPSGCGKSTLLRMIGGFEEPTTGRIILDGNDVTYDPPYKREVNMVFQDYALFPHMTVGQNIGYGLRMKGYAKAEVVEKAVEALALVGLPDKFDKYPNQLSGGQRQRIALARAMVRHPKVLLLDEPLSALDANLREQMQLELKHLHEKVGITFVMVTHDQTEALVMSDRVVVMEKGRVAQQGTPDALYDHPQTPYIANFIGTTNFVDAKILEAGIGESLIEVAGHKLAVENTSQIDPNLRYQAGFRPEKAHFVEKGSMPEGSFVLGHVEEVIYHGSALRTAVRLNSGDSIKVDELLPESMARTRLPNPGTEVCINIAAHNISLFEKEA